LLRASRTFVLTAAAALSLAAGAAAAQPAGPEVVNVQMTEYSFDPADIQLQQGHAYTLHLVNAGENSHALSAKAFFASVSLDPGSAAAIKKGSSIWVAPGHSLDLTLTAGAAGSYEMHGVSDAMFGMRGRIVVLTAAEALLPRDSARPAPSPPDSASAALSPEAGAVVKPGAPGIVDVQMTEYRFEPADIDLRRGRTYTLHLVNVGENSHALSAKAFFASVSLDAGSAAAVKKGSSIWVAPGRSLDLTLTAGAAGSYEMHGVSDAMFGMKGRIVVH
jgi:plastocyanin